MSFSTASVPWNDAAFVGTLADEQDRTFEIMPTLSNAALHNEQTTVQLELRVKAEEEVMQSCESCDQYCG